jgi:hypothetical protein
MSEPIPEWLVDYMRWKYGLPPFEGGQPSEGPPKNPSEGLPRNPKTDSRGRVVKHKGPRIGIDNYGKRPNLSPEDLARLRKANMMKELPTSRSMIGNALSKVRGYGTAAAQLLGRYANPAAGALLAADSYMLYKMARDEREFEQLLNAQMNADRADMGVELDIEAAQGRRPLFATEFFMQNGPPSRNVGQTLAGDIDLARQLRSYLDDQQISRAQDSADFYGVLSDYNSAVDEDLRMQEGENNFRYEQERSRREGTGPTPAYEPRREMYREPATQQDGFFGEIERAMSNIFGS